MCDYIIKNPSAKQLALSLAFPAILFFPQASVQLFCLFLQSFKDSQYYNIYYWVLSDFNISLQETTPSPTSTIPPVVTWAIVDGYIVYDNV